jgi:hypothetical protein
MINTVYTVIAWYTPHSDNLERPKQSSVSSPETLDLEVACYDDMVL